MNRNFVADADAVILNGTKTFLTNGLSTFLVQGKPVFLNGPISLLINPPSYIISEIYEFFRLMY